MSNSSSPSVATPRDPAHEFDVRPLSGRVKHTLIFQRWIGLPVGDFFILVNDHDPKPLYYQFNAEFPGMFSWDYLQRGPEEFRVKITKTHATPGTTEPPQAPCSCGVNRVSVEGTVEEIDVRGLMPPEPLVRILAHLEMLPVGRTLHARTDREPCHLFGEATARGFRHTTAVQPDGSWITALTRA